MPHYEISRISLAADLAHNRHNSDLYVRIETQHLCLINLSASTYAFRAYVASDLCQTYANFLRTSAKGPAPHQRWRLYKSPPHQ
jgi:hypothetical protein